MPTAKFKATNGIVMGHATSGSSPPETFFANEPFEMERSIFQGEYKTIVTQKYPSGASHV
jgi:hypothetical protein